MTEPVQRDLPGLEESSVSSVEILLKGKIWDVVSKKFDFHGQELTREYIQHPGAVAVLAINENNEVLLLRQYRAPVNEYLLEIPAGLKDATDESSLATAKRELAEESDFEAASWEQLQTFYTTPGSSSELIEIFLAKNLTKLEQSFERTDEEKLMTLDWVSFEEILESVKSSKVKSPTLVLAVLAYALRAKD